MTGETPVHVGIVNYFTSRYLETLVPQVIADGAESITVLDNSCDTDEWDRLVALFGSSSTVRLIRSPRNAGFGPGHNRIVDNLAARPDHEIFCILNPDTLVEVGCLPALSHAVSSQPGPVAVAPVVVTGNRGEPRIWFAGGTIDQRRGVVSHDGFGGVPPEPGTPRFPSGFLSGAVVAARLSTWREFPFREDLFLYWEDVELSLRWKDAGVGLLVEPNARVWHEEGGSQAADAGLHGAVYHQFMNRNRVVVLGPRNGLMGLIAGAGFRRTVGQLVAPVRERGFRGGLREFRSAATGLVEGIGVARRSRHGVAGGLAGRPDRQSDAIRVGVFGPTPNGGHPEYIMKSLRGVLSSTESDDLTFVWPRRPDLESRFVVDDFEQPVVIAAQRPRTDMPSRRRWVMERLDPRRRHDVAFLAFLVRNRNFDAILIEEIQRFTLPVLVAVARILGSRTVVRLHNIRRHDYRGSLVDDVDERLTGLGLRRADSVVVHTERNAAVASERFGLANAVVVPHGVSPAESATRPRSGDDPTFLLFGEIRENKGVEVFLEAARRHRGRARFVVAGRADQSMRAVLEAAVAELGERVEWYDGFVSSDDVPALFGRATAAVLPYTRFEAQSGVLHLAIEHGVPVVVSDVGGLGESVHSTGIGLVVPPNDPARLDAALEEIQGAELNAQCRSAAIAAQQTLSWAVVGEALGRVLRG